MRSGVPEDGYRGGRGGTEAQKTTSVITDD